MSIISNNNMIKIKIIRHSERLDHSHPLYWMTCFGQYWADSPLTSKGYRLAREKGKKLIADDYHPSHIYTSPYTRTFATATEIKSSCLDSEIIIEPLIAEHQPRFKDCTNLYPYGIPTIYCGEDTGFSFPETYESFTKRVLFIIFKLIEKHDTDIMVVSHGEVLKVIIRYLQDMFPEVILEPGNTPYLTTISFIFDKINNIIVEQSIQLE